MDTTVDLRGRSEPEREATLVSAFNSLAPGDSLHVRVDEDPLRLLKALKEAHRGEFDWAPLGWDVELTRRTPARGGLRHIAEALSWDHDRLEGLEHAASAAMREGKSEEGARLFGAFVRGLNRHIRFEEEHLFPAIETRSRALPGTGYTQRMRDEHREIRMALDTILRYLEYTDMVWDLRDELEPLLQSHHAEEEEFLHPAVRDLLSAPESDALVTQFQELPA